MIDIIYPHTHKVLLRGIYFIRSISLGGDRYQAEIIPGFLSKEVEYPVSVGSQDDYQLHFYFKGDDLKQSEVDILGTIRYPL